MVRVCDVWYTAQLAQSICRTSSAAISLSRVKNAGLAAIARMMPAVISTLPLQETTCQ